MPYTEPEDHRPEPRLEPPITGPIGWEDPQLRWHQRLLRTLSASFAPIASLHAVAHGEVAPALRFALVSGLPSMLTWAIIPYTHTLGFGYGFTVARLANPTGGVPIELDVLRAMAIGLAIGLLDQLAWSLPFVSLLAAFADGSRELEPKRAGWRTALYRAWVIPLSMLLFYVVPWALPFELADYELLEQSMRVLPRVLVFVHCQLMARYLGASGFGGLMVAVVPQLVWGAASLLLRDVALRLLPPSQ